ncbi:MAG: 6-bladed beta-propeller [Alistipes sp.]|nr:6-bladed beta-propeller [Alistipes sp.]
MKNLFVILVGCVFALGLTGCGSTTDRGLQTLNLAAAIDNPKTTDLAEIAAEVEFIPLDESTPVGEMAILGGLKPAPGEGFYIVAADGMTPVWHFDRTGKFISTVGRIGRGPGETPFINGVTPNNMTGEVYIDGVMDIVGLDTEGGEFARSKSGINWGMTWHGDRLLVLTVPDLFDESAYSGDSLALIEMFDRELRPAGSIHGPNLGPFLGMPTTPQAEDYIAASDPPFLSDNGERLLVRQGRGDTLYQYSAGALAPAYVMDRGGYTPQAELFGVDPVARWSDRNFAVADVWEGERYVIVAVTNMQKNSAGQPIMQGLIFDRDSGGGGLGLGGFSAVGPEGSPGLFLGGVKFTPSYIRNNQLVGYMQALDIVDAAAAKNITDPSLQTLAATLREDDNPVIVIATLNK